MKSADANKLKEFLGEKTSSGAGNNPITGAAEQEAAEQGAGAQVGNALDTVNNNLQGGNQTLSQLNELIGNVAKITDNIGQYFGGKSSQRKSSYNSDHDQELDAFGQPVPSDVSDQAKEDYRQFARRKADERAAQKKQPPAKPPARAKPDKEDDGDPKDEPGQARDTRAGADDAAEMSDAEKAKLTYAFFGEVLRGIEQTDPTATIDKIREEYRNARGRIIQQIEKQIISL